MSARKVKADFDLCESNAICTGLAPDVFELDDDDFLVLLTDDVTSDNEGRIEQAVASCPKAALSIVEGTVGGTVEGTVEAGG
jgi:ferredoxin